LAQQLLNTAGQMGYTMQNNNMYTILADDEDDDTTATDTTLTNVAALNMAALFTGNAMATANFVHESVINAINQLNANQVALVQQMAAMLLNNNLGPPAQITVPVPPINNPYAGAVRGRRNAEYIRSGTWRTVWSRWTRRTKLW
jgi:hypothetical protein